MQTKFGPGGNCELFYESGYKKTTEIPQFLNSINLDAYEIQCGRGVKMGASAANELKENALKYGIYLSVHAPYYISMSSVEEEKRLNSINYILQSCSLAKQSGAKRVIFHTGSCSKISREDALSKAKDTLKSTLLALKENGFEDIILCPETMGKINQLGTPDEVFELCTLGENVIPAIDYGHINARYGGNLKTVADYEKIFDRMENILGYDKAKIHHVHFSKIEYTTGGEKRHLTFEDNVFGPDEKIFLEAILKRGYTPTIICESAGTMSKDALTMKNYFSSIGG